MGSTKSGKGEKASAKSIISAAVKSERFLPFICISVLVVGFILRLYYVHITPFDVSTHDLGYKVGYRSDTVGTGHLGYIEYICNNLQLPDFSPLERWSFYNPPFFHLTSAILLRFFIFLGIPYDASWELLQYYPCVTIFFATLGVYKILRKLNINDLVLPLSCVFVAFSPSLSYLSTTLNNDPLSVAFIIWTVYFALVWHEKPSTRTIVPVALCIGLGMMTKLTVALIAPPVAVIFAFKFFKEKKYLVYLKQFCIFAAVCVPLGMFWSVRNILLYELPMTYVQEIPAKLPQNISGHSTWEKFGIPPLSDLTNIYSSWGEGSEASFNMWSQTLRTAIFDENMLTFHSVAEQRLALILMLLTLGVYILLAVVSVIGFLRAKNTAPVIRTSLAFACVLLLLNFVKFCHDYQRTATFHFRYIVPVLLYMCIGFGLYTSSSKKSLPNKIIVAAVSFGILITSTLSAVLYTCCL